MTLALLYVFLYAEPEIQSEMNKIKNMDCPTLKNKILNWNDLDYLPINKAEFEYTWRCTK